MRKEFTKKSSQMVNSELRSYNSMLKKNLKFLADCSNENEKSQERIEQMEEEIFLSDDLGEMLFKITTVGANIFGLDLITVAFLPEFERLYSGRYSSAQAVRINNGQNVLFMDEPLLAAQLADPHNPQLRGNLRHGNRDLFPGERAKRIRSEALAPVDDGKRLLGIVAFGSYEPTRFLDSHGTRFIKRLGRIISLKMDVFLKEELIQQQNREPAGLDCAQ